MFVTTQSQCVYILCTNRLSTQFKILRVKSSATVQHPLSNGQLTRIGVSSGFTGCHILLVAHSRRARHQCVMSLRMPGHQFCQLALLEWAKMFKEFVFGGIIRSVFSGFTCIWQWTISTNVNCDAPRASPCALFWFCRRSPSSRYLIISCKTWSQRWHLLNSSLLSMAEPEFATTARKEVGFHKWMGRNSERVSVFNSRYVNSDLHC